MSLIVIITFLSFSTLSYAQSAHETNSNWLFVGAEFNYSEKMIVKQPSYNNNSLYFDYFEVTSLGKQIFNFSERSKVYGHLGLPQNGTLPLNASVVISQKGDTGSYPGGSFFVVNGSILKQIAVNASLYYNYKNSTAPLNISMTNYTLGSMEIPSYRLSAIEPTYTFASPSDSTNHVRVIITLVVDASNGIVLYENENQTYPETFFIDTIFTIQNSNFQMTVTTHTSQYNLTWIVLTIVILAGLSVLIYATRFGRR